MTLHDRKAGQAAAGLGRRRVLGMAGATIAGGGLLAACSDSEGGGGETTNAAAAGAQGGLVPLAGSEDLPEIQWDLATSWPAASSAFGNEENGVGATGFANDVARLTGGRFVLTPRVADEVAGAFEIIDAIQSGGVPAGHTTPAPYTGRSPVFAIAGGLPFGLNFRQHYAWLYHYRDEAGRSGIEVMRELYANEFGLIQFPCGSSGVQMGGFFNREIGSLADLQGLVMRIPGLGGEIMSRLGVTTQNLPAGEIAQSLQTGSIDAAEFAGPFDDNAVGLGQAARFYYYPGWWETVGALEVFIDLNQYNELPEPYQNALEIAGQLQYQALMGFLDAQQPFALEEIRAQGAETRVFPEDLLTAAFDEAEALLDEISGQDPNFATALEHWRPYRDAVQQWHGLAERTMLDVLAVRQPETSL